MKQYSKWAYLGILLVFCLILYGCKTEPVNILEVAEIAESVPVDESAPDTQPEDDSTAQEVKVEPELGLLAEVYFAEGHGDDGLGIVMNSDADIEEVQIELNSANAVWGSRTGNGAILPAPDGNQIEDSFFRFDLQDHIFFENHGSAEFHIEVEYLDIGQDEFSLEYDAIQGGQGGDEFLKSTDFIKKTDSGELKVASFVLKDAFMGNRLNDNSDFQINDLGDGAEIIFKVTVQIFDVADNISAEPQAEDIAVDPDIVEGYAILAEKDDFSDVGLSGMPVDYIDIELLREMLLGLGWNPENIHELPEFDRNSLVAELDWLEEVADENDIVFMFVTSHSSYLRNNLDWPNFFPQEWAEIQSQRRILLVDMCLAARMTVDVIGDPNSHLSIAVADIDELTWKSLPGEGFSFIGAVFNHYFVEAFSLPEVDTDGDGRVSVQEAAIYGEAKQRDFLHLEVFANPDYLVWFHDNDLYYDEDPTFPDVIFDDTIGEPIFLDLDFYQ